MKEPQDAEKYQVNNKTVQGQVIGDQNKVEMHFHPTQDKATPSIKPHQPWNIPYPYNPFFTGREDLLSRLQKQLQTGQPSALSQPQAVSGLGGIGKTQIAVQYAHKHRDDYQAVLWARTESHEALTSSFVEIARLLDLPQKDEQDQTIIVQAVKRWLQDNHGWLLILDNADEPAIVREFLPTKFDGHILLTTRAQALGGLAQRIEVDTFTPELGALFLLRRATLIAADDVLGQASPQDRELALQISQKLGGLPLALDQAGAYIEQTQCSLSDYLSLYRTRRAEMLKQYGPLEDNDPHKPVVATTWSLSFQRAKEKCAAAADLLRLCAFLAPDAIPEEIVIKGAEHLGPVLQAAANDPIALNKAIATLGAYSLIGRDTTEKTLSIHRLVQAVLRDVMLDGETRLWAERTVLAVSEACPAVKFATWAQWERYLPQAQACADLIEQEYLKLAEAASLLTKAGHYLHERARYTDEAERLYVRALTIREQQLGLEHPDTATSLTHLALLYANQGKYSQAEPLYIRALDIREQQLGQEHPDTATSLNNLASLYISLGKYSQAEPLLVRALTIRKQQLGQEHPDTATSLNDLAWLYAKQGKYSQAESLAVRALNIREQHLGQEHPDTVTSLNNLAWLYISLGKYYKVEPLFVRALNIRKQQLGLEHPDTATCLDNQAVLYTRLGKYAEAEPLHVHALSIYEQRSGPEHPNTATCLNNLALLYARQEKYSEAEPLLVRALSIYERQLGREHPDAATILNNLALLYTRQEKYPEAEPLLVRALDIREQQLGQEHPDTATSLNNLALLYARQGKYVEAEPLLVRALTIPEQQFEQEYSYIPASLNNLPGLL